ncbi:MAG: ferritin-like domain-containing protein [Kofleriaceae bacterium]|nr:ferritin-like domain-containing protein [Myxococcales bacterium]MCB9562795.1 ferritin-like domain-containing protein [Kofleriaceae bacterium]MCB9571114.1 ferritin-like domain-containing protein [Kofleriaceae bacterium]
MPDVAQHLALSQKLQYDDLDWDLARAHGISATEADCLQYFADIESQTVFYMLEVAKLEVARDPELLAFLTIWNYEEFFHAQALTRFLTEVGVVAPDAAARSHDVRRAAQLRATVEDWVQVTLARALPRTFVALWQCWGAAAELLTTQAYEQIMRTTANPVLRELCRRIARQERRHFAWYLEASRERLAGERFAQRVVRKVFELNWTPVGSGVKSPAQVAAQIARIFPGERIYEVLGTIDRRMGTLPGMAGFDVCGRYADRIQALLPVEARVVRRAGVDYGADADGEVAA